MREQCIAHLIVVLSENKLTWLLLLSSSSPDGVPLLSVKALISLSFSFRRPNASSSSVVSQANLSIKQPGRRTHYGVLAFPDRRGAPHVFRHVCHYCFALARSSSSSHSTSNFRAKKKTFALLSLKIVSLLFSSFSSSSSAKKRARRAMR